MPHKQDLMHRAWLCMMTPLSEWKGKEPLTASDQCRHGSRNGPNDGCTDRLSCTAGLQACSPGEPLLFCLYFVALGRQSKEQGPVVHRAFDVLALSEHVILVLFADDVFFSHQCASESKLSSMLCKISGLYIV